MSDERPRRLNTITDELVADISADEVFDLLSNERRRHVLQRLRTVEEPITVTELAELVAATENDVAPDELTDKQRKRVYVSLYQTHVPKLADAGVVDYDEDDSTAILTTRGEALTEYFAPSTTSDESYPWPAHYAGLAVLGLVGVAVWTVFPGVPLVAVTVGLVLLVGGSAVVQFTGS